MISSTVRFSLGGIHLPDFLPNGPRDEMYGVLMKRGKGSSSIALPRARRVRARQHFSRTCR
jgi:hypothetical protein